MLYNCSYTSTIFAFKMDLVLSNNWWLREPVRWSGYYVKNIVGFYIFFKKFHRCSTPQYNNNLLKRRHSARCKYSSHEATLQIKIITICVSQVALAHIVLLFLFISIPSCFFLFSLASIMENMDLNQLVRKKNERISFGDDNTRYMSTDNITNLVEL